MAIIYELTFDTCDPDFDDKAYVFHVKPEVVGPPYPVRAGNCSMRCFLDRWGTPAEHRHMCGIILGPDRYHTFHLDIGEEYWIGLSTYVPADMVVDQEGLTELLIEIQAHPDPGEQWRQPHFAIWIDEDRWEITTRWDSRAYSPDMGWEGHLKLYDAPIGGGLGNWTDWVIHYKLSYESDGFIEVWRDGVRVVDYSGPCCSNDQTGPQIYTGMYKWPWRYDFATNSATRLVYIDELKIGDANACYADVAPGEGTSTSTTTTSTSTTTTSTSTTQTGTSTSTTVTSTSTTSTSLSTTTLVPGTEVQVAATRVACNTTESDQEITTAACGGLTPKAAWFIVTRATADGVAADHAVIGTGAVTGETQQWAICTSSQHGVGTTNVRKWGASDECVLILDPTDGSVDGEASFVDFIKNGVRIYWDNPPSSAYLLTVVLFAGQDVEAYAGRFQPDGTTGNVVDVTAPGFEPDLILTAGNFWDMDDAGESWGQVNYGLVANVGGGLQGSRCMFSQHDAATSNVEGGITATDGHCQATGADFRCKLLFHDFDNAGFSVKTEHGDASSRDVGYLALRFGGAIDVWAGPIETRTAIGNEAYTGLGFKPQAVFILPTFLPTFEAWDATGLAGTNGWAVVTPTASYCNSIQDEDGQATTDTQSLSDNVAVNLPQDDGTAGFVCTLVSMDADGWTLNFGTTDGTVRRWYACGIKEAAAPAAVGVIVAMVT